MSHCYPFRMQNCITKVTLYCFNITTFCHRVEMADLVKTLKKKKSYLKLHINKFIMGILI